MDDLWHGEEGPHTAEDILAHIQYPFYTGYLVIHWAHSDGGGEQPAFGPGWFYKCGDGYAELSSQWKILRWKHIN